MKVWIVWDQVPFEGDRLLAVCASLETAEQAAEPHRGTAFIEISEHDVIGKMTEPESGG